MIFSDLELLTSLDVQAVDSKVDNLAVEHASSQHTNVNHLKRIQQEVQSVGAVQHITHETTLGISRSTDKIHDTVQDIQMSQATSHQTTRRQLESLDARIAAMQRSILNIPHQKGAKTRRRVRKPDPRRYVSQEEHSFVGAYSELEQRTPNPPAVPTQLNRVVDIALTARHRCGKWHLEALAIPDSAFEAADFGTRLRMVKYLQDLRLLLWLLCRKECGRDWLLNPSGLPRSELITEAHLFSTWSLVMVLDIHPRFSLGNSGNKRDYHEKWLSWAVTSIGIDRIISTRSFIRPDEVPQVTVNADQLITTTAALLLGINKWVDAKLEYIRHMGNLRIRWQLARQEFPMEDELKRIKSQVFMMEVVRQAISEEAFFNERKREEALCLEELFDHSTRRRLLAMEILQKPAEFWALAYSLLKSAW